ncbi:MAG: Eco57I restriction-modification methylase domain-containing protein, partial [Bacillota bacterium]|nr:Eco57I restriction-modification methylase domain-containing protein [Bacillota bacterium]
MAKAALVEFWQDWQGVLGTIRVLDPACGSGAFLIEAFDQLHREYRAANSRLDELRGHAELFDLDRLILQQNLYGVDLNDEAIEICRLSLWIKTAAQGKPLTSLDHTIRAGNSVVSDAAVHPKAFNWQAAFPEVFANGGFDVVIGNPPYIRQEWLSPFKPYLEEHFRSYHGMADLYVYFYELGVQMLRPGGLLSYVVTNKWMRAGYAEPLRRLFQGETWVESVVDFGHAKQIFPDADVFPSIVVVRKPRDVAPPAMTRVCAIPRDELRVNDLQSQIDQIGVSVERTRLGAGPWSLEDDAAEKLMQRIAGDWTSLSEFVGAKPLRGILTGFNEAFLIDSATRKSLTEAGPECSEIVRPFVRGQDLGR